MSTTNSVGWRQVREKLFHAHFLTNEFTTQRPMARSLTQNQPLHKLLSNCFQKVETALAIQACSKTKRK